MANVRIVTDSTAELDPELAKALQITVVPWRISAGAETLIDGPQLQTAQFHQNLLAQRIRPRPLPPSSQQFGQVFDRLAQQTDQILVITPSGGFTPVPTACQRARTSVLGRCQVQVIDSRFISRPLGVAVTEAAQLAQSGTELPEIVRRVNHLLAQTYVAFYTEVYDYLIESGAAEPSIRRAARPPTYYPILLIEDGQVVPIQRSRKRGEPVERMVEFIAEFLRIRELAILTTGSSPWLDGLITLLGESLSEQPFTQHIVGPVTASILGPRALGMSIIEH